MYPLPVINPKIPRNRYTADQRLGAITSTIALFLFVIFVPTELSDMILLGIFLSGIWFVWFECLLTENSHWWAEKLNGLLGRKGV